MICYAWVFFFVVKTNKRWISQKLWMLCKTEFTNLNQRMHWRSSVISCWCNTTTTMTWFVSHSVQIRWCVPWSTVLNMNWLITLIATFLLLITFKSVNSDHSPVHQTNPFWCLSLLFLFSPWEHVFGRIQTTWIHHCKTMFSSWILRILWPVLNSQLVSSLKRNKVYRWELVEDHRVYWSFL